jgi:hypothetical protein
MGRTYHPANKATEPFDANVAGTELLSRLVRLLNLERADYSGHPTLAGKFDPPWECGPNRAEKMARQLAVAPDNYLRSLGEEVKHDRLFDGTPDEFVAFVREWQHWLEKCGGYVVR